MGTWKYGQKWTNLIYRYSKMSPKRKILLNKDTLNLNDILILTLCLSEDFWILEFHNENGLVFKNMNKILAIEFFNDLLNLIFKKV